MLNARHTSNKSIWAVQGIEYLQLAQIFLAQNFQLRVLSCKKKFSEEGSLQFLSQRRELWICALYSPSSLYTEHLRQTSILHHLEEMSRPLQVTEKNQNSKSVNTALCWIASFRQIDTYMCIFCRRKTNIGGKKPYILQTTQKGFQHNYQALRESYLWKVLNSDQGRSCSENSIIT